MKKWSERAQNELYNTGLGSRKLSPGKQYGNVLTLGAVWVGEVTGPELGWVRGMDGPASSTGKLLPAETCPATVYHIESISCHLHKLHSVAECDELATRLFRPISAVFW